MKTFKEDGFVKIKSDIGQVYVVSNLASTISTEKSDWSCLYWEYRVKLYDDDAYFAFTDDYPLVEPVGIFAADSIMEDYEHAIRLFESNPKNREMLEAAEKYGDYNVA